MRDLFFKLFKVSHFDTGIEITVFSASHLIYMALIAGGIIGGYFYLRNKSTETKIKAMQIILYALALSYFADFFVHDFVYADYDDAGNLISGGGLNMDKLPFHICTALCPISLFVQFNKSASKFKEPVVILAILSSLMYLCYPASIGSGEPWCYKALQTMFFHGALLSWGILNIALGIVKLHIKRCYQSAILLVLITLWAKLGCLLLEHNWFFLEEDVFGMVENGYISKGLLMIINPSVFFLAVLILYGVCHLAVHLKNRKKTIEEKTPQHV